MQWPRFRTARFVLVVAMMEMFLGLSIYAFPAGFRSAFYSALRPFFPYLSALLVAGGVELLLLLRHPLPRWVRRLLIWFPAAPFLWLAAYFGYMAGWTGLLLYGIMGAFLVAVPWVEDGGEPLSRSSAHRDRPHLCALALGLVQGGLGGLMLLEPQAFSMPAYLPLQPVQPLAGVAGLLGAGALILPHKGRWATPVSPLRRVLGAIFPLMLSWNFAMVRGWTGVLTYGLWALALLLDWPAPAGWRGPEGGAQGKAAAGQPPPAGAAPDEPGSRARGSGGGGGEGEGELLQDQEALERTLEGWSWVLALLVVALTPVCDVCTAANPVVGHLFVLAVSGLNMALYLGGNRFGPAPRRTLLRLVFLTVTIGVFLTGSGPMGQHLLLLLVLIPPLAVRSAGPDAGRPMLALTLAVVLLVGLFKGLSHQAPMGQVLGGAFVDILVLSMAGFVGIRSAASQVQLLGRLEAVRASLQRQVGTLVLMDRIGDAVRRSLDLKEILRTTVVEVGDALGASRCLIRLRTGEGGSAGEAPVAYQYTAPGVSPIARNHPGLDVTTRALRLGQMVTAGPGESPSLQALGVQAAMAAPIWVQGELVGAIGCHQTDRDRTWSQEEQRFLAAIAGQVGVALTHARAHQALRESEERFRTAFEHAAIGMALVSTEGRFLQVNQALAVMFGYPAAELVGRNEADLSHPDDLRLGADLASRLLAGGRGSLQAEKRYIHKDGHMVWTQVSVSMVWEEKVPRYLIAQVQDITDRKRYEAQLVHLANNDTLTGLYNRRRFEEELDRELLTSRRTGVGGALFFLDLDQFKYVNDTLGHQTGDGLLKSLSSLLRRQLGHVETIARLGGDEFGILLPRTDAPGARQAAEELLTALRGNPLMVGGRPVAITASIGVALYPEHGTRAQELLARADLALYQAKEMGRNRVCFYTDQAEQAAESKMTWELRIREALAQGRMVLHYQPIVDLRTDAVIQYEVLLRMTQPDGTLIPPGVFLGVAERFGLIAEVDRWVVRQAIHRIAAARDKGQRLVLEVNLSARALVDPELLPLIQKVLQETGIDPAQLVLEITETAAIADIQQARRFIETLKGLGCRFAIDDFGTGYSSFYYLKHLPVDYLKIDGSFIRDLPRDPADQHLVQAMVQVALGLGKQTIAECVEDAGTLALIRRFGVDCAQGYHIGRPAGTPLPAANYV